MYGSKRLDWNVKKGIYNKHLHLRQRVRLVWDIWRGVLRPHKGRKSALPTTQVSGTVHNLHRDRLSPVCKGRVTLLPRRTAIKSNLCRMGRIDTAAHYRSAPSNRKIGACTTNKNQSLRLHPCNKFGPYMTIKQSASTKHTQTPSQIVL